MTADQAAAVPAAAVVVAEAEVTDLQQLADKILSLNLDFVHEQLQRKKKWSQERIAAADVEYRKFLWLLGKYPRETIVPWGGEESDLDEYWHTHILNTREYARDCNALFGRFIHHNPQLLSGSSGHSLAWQRTCELIAHEERLATTRPRP